MILKKIKERLSRSQYKVNNENKTANLKELESAEKPAEQENKPEEEEKPIIIYSKCSPEESAYYSRTQTEILNEKGYQAWLKRQGEGSNKSINTGTDNYCGGFENEIMYENSESVIEEEISDMDEELYNEECNDLFSEKDDNDDEEEDYYDKMRRLETEEEERLHREHEDYYAEMERIQQDEYEQAMRDEAEFWDDMIYLSFIAEGSR